MQQYLQHDKLNTPFPTYSNYIRKTFGERVQKISINAGFTCPNIDGTKGKGGCTYCNNKTFNPAYTSASKSVVEQIDEGISFFKKKYKSQKYLAYFQSFSNTYAPVEKLESLYYSALQHKDVIGLVISTRPDTINDGVVSLLEKIARTRYVEVELGIESTNNDTLHKINRCHTYEDTTAAYKMLENKNIKLGGHLILGLPGETRKDFETHAKRISKLPLDFLKLHQLQIIKGTQMAKEYRSNPENFNLFTLDGYINEVVNFLKFLRKGIIIERFSSESPLSLLIAPKWNGVKNFEITEKIKKKMIAENITQGDMVE